MQQLTKLKDLVVKYWSERGYTPYEEHLSWMSTEEGSGFGASHTLEYSFSSNAVARFARHLNKMDD